MAIPVDDIWISNDQSTGEIVVSISISIGGLKQNFDVIRVSAPGGGVLSHCVSALGMRQRIHRATDGCDLQQDVKKGKLVLIPCTRPNHV